MPKENVALNRVDQINPSSLSIENYELNSILLNKLHQIQQGKISAIIFTSDYDPAETFQEMSSKEMRIKIINYPSFKEIRLDRTKLIDEIDMISEPQIGYFYQILIEDGIWAILSTEDDRFVDIFHNMIKNGSPQISRMNFTSKQIMSILQDLAERGNYRIRIKKAITRPFGGKADINFEPRDLEDLFQHCIQEHLYLDKARLEVFKNGIRSLDAYVSRDGIIRYYSGNLTLFFNVFLFAFAGTATQTKKKLEKRERSFGSLNSKPLEIEFSSDVFRNPEDNFKFINSIESIKKSGISVYHKNPYLHLSFVDYQDGSTYDIFAVTQRSICIVPSFRSSTDSLIRLSSHIFENVGEGIIRDWEEKGLTKADFFE
jgi:hypothetical protein